MRRWFGIRRLYEPRFQERVLLLLLLVISGYYVLWSVIQWLTLTPATLRFDFVNYFGGAQAAWHGSDIYADFKHSWGGEAWVVAYIYPPFFAEILAPLTPLGLVAAARIWLLAVHTAFVASLWLLLRINPELSKIGRRLFLLAALGFMPVYLNLKFQQVATVWLLLLSASVWASRRRRDGAAGTLLAIAASLKVSPVFLIPLYARLGRWRIAIIGTVALVGITALTMLLAPGSWQFFTVVLPRIGLGTANWDNGSVNGLVSRIVELSPALLGSATQSIAKVVIALATVLVIGYTLWQARRGSQDSPSPLAGEPKTSGSRDFRRGQGPGQPAHASRAERAMRAFEASGGGSDSAWTLRLSVAALVTSLLIVSSVTWQHHLVTLLLPIATAMAWIAVRHPGARYGWWLFSGYALCWMDRRAFPLPADLQVHSAAQGALVLIGTSVKLAGLVLLWTLLLQMLRRERALALTRPDSRRSLPAA